MGSFGGGGGSRTHVRRSCQSGIYKLSRNISCREAPLSPNRVRLPAGAPVGQPRVLAQKCGPHFRASLLVRRPVCIGQAPTQGTRYLKLGSECELIVCS